MPPPPTITPKTIPRLVRQLLPSRPLALCLDYDGTLVPIAPTPAQARPTPRLLTLLDRLGHLPHLHTAIVTGRPMTDIRSLLPIDHIDFISDHGAQVLSPSRHILWTDPQLADRTAPVRHADHLLRQRLAGLQGIHLETKPFSVVLHLRQAPPKTRQEASAVLRRTATELRLAVLPGKAVLELRIPGLYDKASGVRNWCRHVLHRQPAAFLAAGDDRTDEDTFRLLRHHGLTILVGRPKTTAARWRAPGPPTLLRLLEALADALAEDAAPALSSPPS